MPWTIQDPPPPAKNWGYKQRYRCVHAANAVLNRGGTDEEAVFACIAAAGKGEKQGPDEYDELSEDASESFIYLTNLYLTGQITKDVFDKRFRQNIYDYFIALMSIHVQEPTDRDIALLNHFYEKQNKYFDGFLEDIDEMTPARAAWRAGLYGYSRHVYVAYSIPIDVAELMPVLPGEDCLGGDLCHCSLDIQYNSDGDVLVYWVLDPSSESCSVCISHAVESPFVFTARELRGD